MKVDSLDELKVVFAMWRQAKRHVREAVPDDLLRRARRAAKAHGVKAVVKAVRVERSRIFRCQRQDARAASSILAPKLLLAAGDAISHAGPPPGPSEVDPKANLWHDVARSFDGPHHLGE